MLKGRAWRAFALSVVVCVAVAAFAGLSAPAVAAEQVGEACFDDLTHYIVSGILRTVNAVGPDDQPVRPYVLELDEPLCFVLSAEGDVEGIAAPGAPQRTREVQVAFSFEDHQAFVAANLNHRVSLLGRFYAVHSGHHYLPVLMLAGRGDPAPR